MAHFITAIHILAAILLLGPVAISTSMFAPQFAKAQGGDTTAAGGVKLLARITRTYGFVSLLVPALGVVALLTVPEASQNYKLHAAALLAIAAWVVLIAVVIPRQRLALVSLGALDASDAPASEKEQEQVASLDPQKLRAQSAMFAGIFNLLWVITAVLMFI